jgi:hypothetical protein
LRAGAVAPTLDVVQLPFKTRRAGARELLSAARETYRAYSTPTSEPVAAPVPRRQPRQRPQPQPAQPPPAGDEPDVLLDVPTLKVSDIDLEVDDLRARVALRAHVLDLLQIDVGADVSLDRVKLGVHGVEAEALLKVRLAHVAEMVGRVMDTIDHNPQLLEALVDRVDATIEDLGAGASRAVGELVSPPPPTEEP